MNVVSILGPAGSGKTYSVFKLLSGEKYSGLSKLYLTKFKATFSSALSFNHRFNAGILVFTIDGFAYRSYDINIERPKVLTIETVPDKLKKYVLPGVVFEINQPFAITNNVIFLINLFLQKNLKYPEISEIENFLEINGVKKNLIHLYRDVYHEITKLIENGYKTFAHLLIELTKLESRNFDVLILDEAQLIFSPLMDKFIKKYINPKVFIVVADINQFDNFFGSDYKLFYETIKKSEIKWTNKVYRYGKRMGSKIKTIFGNFGSINEIPSDEKTFIDYKEEYERDDGDFIKLDTIENIEKIVGFVEIKDKGTTGILVTSYNLVRKIIKRLINLGYAAFFLRDLNFLRIKDLIDEIIDLKESGVDDEKIKTYLDETSYNRRANFEIVYKSFNNFWFRFRDKKQTIEAETFKNNYLKTRHAFAVSTLPSAPGITFDNVIVMVNRRFFEERPKTVYTALTRAKEKSILIIQ